MKENFKITDAHCHIFPAKIAERAVHGTDTFYGFEAIYGGTAEALTEAGREHGVDHFIIHSVATTPKQVHSINTFIAEEMQAHESMTGLGTLHPAVEDISADIAEIQALGLHGVKIHPDIQRFELDDARMMRAYAICEELRLPVLMHTGDMRYDYSNPNRLKHVLETFPKLTVIGAHFGGWSVWDQVIGEGLGDYENFYVDSSSVFGFIRHNTICADASRLDERIPVNINWELWVQLIAYFGPDKILFGTDYPTWDIDAEVDALVGGARELGMGDAEIRKMLSGNAERVYKF